MAKINFFRLYPYGGGSNLALLQSLMYFSVHTGNVYTETPQKAICGENCVLPTNFKLQELRTTKVRLGVNLIAHIKYPNSIDKSQIFDVAEVTNGFTEQLARIALNTRTPLIVTSIETVNHRMFNSIPPFRNRLKLLIGTAYAFRVYTVKSKMFLISIGVPEEKIHIIPLGIDTNVFRPLNSKYNHELTVLYARNLERKNGIEELVRAVKILVNKKKKIRLIIAGKGPLFSTISAMIRNFPIEMVGQVSYHQLAQLYAKADIYCNAARDRRVLNKLIQEDGQYTFPLLESQASGLPLITTVSGSNEEIVHRGNVLIRENTPYSIANSIEYLMEENLRKDIGMNNRKFILRQFNAKLLQAYADKFYSDILK